MEYRAPNSADAPFLRSILDAPHADAPRLVYADWLSERGDVRGEFIRLQCALAHLPNGHPERAALIERERTLYRRHAASWAGPLVGKATRCTFRRGFVEAATMPAISFLTHAEAIFAAAPIYKIALTQSKPVINRIADCKYLRRITELDLTANDLTDSAIEKLEPSPYFDHLRSLCLSVNGLTDRAVLSLTKCHSLGCLRRLDLSHNHIRRPARILRVAELAELDVAFNEISTADCASILSVHSFLQSLRLAGNPIGDDGVAGLIEAPAFLHLARGGAFDFSDCELGPAAVQSLVQSQHRSLFHTLTLDNNAIGDEGLIALTAAAGLDELRKLSLADNGITDAGAQALADSALFSQIEALDLHGNRLSRVGIDALWANERRHPRLKLDLANNTPPPPWLIEDPHDESPIKVDWESNE